MKLKDCYSISCEVICVLRMDPVKVLDLKQDIYHKLMAEMWDDGAGTLELAKHECLIWWMWTWAQRDVAVLNSLSPLKASILHKGNDTWHYYTSFHNYEDYYYQFYPPIVHVDRINQLSRRLDKEIHAALLPKPSRGI